MHQVYGGYDTFAIILTNCADKHIIVEAENRGITCCVLAFVGIIFHGVLIKYAREISVPTAPSHAQEGPTPARLELGQPKVVEMNGGLPRSNN
uniref:Sulfate_transp domain-containing protein n=1 Tax=Steinernema glaseri TaxID=37863 RepID=A0A1I7YEB7_9BILA